MAIADGMVKKHIPNFITCLNLFFGSIAVVYAGKDALVISSLFIGIAVAMDFFDGLAARLLKATTEIGQELDSLADLVSFGVAPGLIAFQLLSHSGTSIQVGNVNILPFAGLLIPVFSALRLARFNIDTTQAVHFRGLPVPANALLFASFPLTIFHPLFSESFLHGFIDQALSNAVFLVAITILFSLLLVGRFWLFSLKFKNLSWKNHKIQFIFLLFALILLIVFNFAAVPVIIVLYVVMSLAFSGKVINNK